MNKPHHLLAGCSFTDPTWQHDVPWSVEYGKQHSCYIVAKAGMGIYGICTETLYWLQRLTDVDKVIVILPTLWRMDIEVDQETNLCNAMVDLLTSSNDTWKIETNATRKWITSGGLHYERKTERTKIFDLLYKHKGFLVIALEHIRALKMLINFCNYRKIAIHISAIQDPLDQLLGLEYIKSEVTESLESVNYNSWIRFDGQFIDKFLGHTDHPTTEEHKILCQHIIKNI